MKFVEYGTQNKEVIILLHGGGLSWWNYREEAELLQEDYHVILPVLDGHAGSDKDFVSMIESALVIPMWITHYLVKPMVDMSHGLIKKKWFSKLQFKSLHMKEELYEDYYKDSVGITKENMISFLRGNSSYKVNEEIRNTNAKVHILVGQKESYKMRRSAEKLNMMMPESILEVLDGMYHGEFSLNCAQKYVAMVKKIVK